MQKRDKNSDIKSFDAALEIKNISSEEPGTFEGYGSVFGNIDRDGDIMAKGSFAESIMNRNPKLLWQHDAKQPIGVFTEVREDDNGLYVKGKLSMTGKGAEAYDLLKMGALSGMSVGFITRQASRDQSNGIRTITKADLMEVSLVTFAANELAEVTSVKSFNAHNIDTETKSEDTEYEKDGSIIFSAAVNMAKSIIGISDPVDGMDDHKDNIEQIYKTLGFASPFEDGGFVDQKMFDSMNNREIEKSLRLGVRFSRDAAKAIVSQREAVAETADQCEADETISEIVKSLNQMTANLKGKSNG